MKPKYLTKGSKIHLVAPSFGAVRFPYGERMRKSKEVLENLGYEIIEGENTYKAEKPIASTSAKKRAKEFMNAYASDCDAIFSVGGGEVMIEILPYINFKKIKKQTPKWFMGYSDNTNLTYTLTTMCDIETIYGPNAPSFYDICYDTKDALRMLTGETEFLGYPKWQSIEDKSVPFAPYNLDKVKKITAKNYHPFEGTLLGGCFDILTLLCGTEYDHTVEYCDKHPEGIIFFLEACDMNPLQIKRSLFQLKHANWFKNVKGFIIGRSRLNEKAFNLTPERAYIEELKELNVPILLNVDLGHLSPALPFRCGAYCNVELTSDNNIKMTYND